MVLGNVLLVFEWRLRFCLGRRYVTQLGAALMISQSLIDSGMQIFKLAAANNFIQGRRTKSVAAVCLYIACRIQKDTNRVMLIDFSDVLQVSSVQIATS